MGVYSSEVSNRFSDSWQQADGCSVCFSIHSTLDKGWTGWEGRHPGDKVHQPISGCQAATACCWWGTGSILSAGQRQVICMRKEVMVEMVVAVVCVHAWSCECACVCMGGWLCMLYWIGLFWCCCESMFLKWGVEAKGTIWEIFVSRQMRNELFGWN